MIRHIFREALSALGHYRLRSALTMLSIIWGVASLMLLLAYGQGFERALTKAFLQIGKDLVVVFPGQTSMQAGGERSGRPLPSNSRTSGPSQEGVPTVEAVSPEFRRFPLAPLAIGRAVTAWAVCMPPTREFATRSWPTGRFLSEEDVRAAPAGGGDRREPPQELFSGMPALGGEISSINGVRFTVDRHSARRRPRSPITRRRMT